MLVAGKGERRELSPSQANGLKRALNLWNLGGAGKGIDGGQAQAVREDNDG